MISINHLCFTITERRDDFEITLRSFIDGSMRSRFERFMAAEGGYPYRMRKPISLREVELECDHLARAIGWR